MDYNDRSGLRACARVVSACLLLIAPHPGCDANPGDSGTDSTTDETTGTSGATSGGDTDDEMVCYDHQPADEADLPPPLSCSYAEPCPAVAWAGACEGDVYDPAAGACVIASLQDGEQAVHRLVRCVGAPIDEWSLTVTSLGDGTVVWEEKEYPAGDVYLRTTWRALPEASYFDGCDAQEFSGLRTCLRGLLEQECQLGAPSCS
ncbi:MAG: hypothetical protein H6713_15490 [Myxococcales bacterium]|nr:hypothetical protein [Myxococcales bacterium]MCB9751379.1 hypothetical protein [Myxococcales bacterium]